MKSCANGCGTEVTMPGGTLCGKPRCFEEFWNTPAPSLRGVARCNKLVDGRLLCDAARDHADGACYSSLRRVPRCNKIVSRTSLLCDGEPGHGGSGCYSTLLRRTPT